MRDCALWPWKGMEGIVQVHPPSLPSPPPSPLPPLTMSNPITIRTRKFMTNRLLARKQMVRAAKGRATGGNDRGCRGVGAESSGGVGADTVGAAVWGGGGGAAVERVSSRLCGDARTAACPSLPPPSVFSPARRHAFQALARLIPLLPSRGPVRARERTPVLPPTPAATTGSLAARPLVIVALCSSTSGLPHPPGNTH